MKLYFYLRPTKGNSKVSTIYKCLEFSRGVTERSSLRIKIPNKLWDKRAERVKESNEINFQSINFILNQLEAEFLSSNKQMTKSDKNCFLEYAYSHIESEYQNEETKKKYTTIINSLKKYCGEILNINTLPFSELSKISFIEGYKKWVFIRQYNNRDTTPKKTKTAFNYVIVIQKFIKEYNAHNPEKTPITTIHYTNGIKKFEVEEPTMLLPEDINKLISYQSNSTGKRDFTNDAKHQFLFQFFTSGMRVSDLLLLNFKHFVKGRIVFNVKKSGRNASILFDYNSAKVLGYFYPQEFEEAITRNKFIDLKLTTKEVEELSKIDSSYVPLTDFTVLDLKKFKQFLSEDKLNDNTRMLKILDGVIERLESNVANSMCEIMSSKNEGFVFDYLNYEDFKNIQIRHKTTFTKEQVNKLHRARTKYNGRLKRIGKRIGIEKLSSHVSRHSFSYSMILQQARPDQISISLVHANQSITEAYIKRFPDHHSDAPIKRVHSMYKV
ncbi:tyrosine-type recombinase/integrase [Aquirufa echingensis]|uniref:Tyrosine-type recombinase/integrase n=1 Tax=Aquirufa echingensis TaxID=3096516 RepID=A0ABW6CW80_9BACT